MKRIIDIVRMPFAGLIKRTLRKRECVALKNEINVTVACLCNLFAGRTKAWAYYKDRANFILAIHSNF
jgi:hypothetical protein